jgi:hypothetical protein
MDVLTVIEKLAVAAAALFGLLARRQARQANISTTRLEQYQQRNELDHTWIMQRLTSIERSNSEESE